MDAFEVLANKGAELVAQRDKTANEGERALLNGQIKQLNRRSHKSLLTLLKPPDWRNALPG